MEAFPVVRDTLLEYAERGVFRGFDFKVEDSAGEGAGAIDAPDRTRVVTFRFFWIGPRPFRIFLSPDGRTLTAEGLLPSVADHPGIREDLERFVGERARGGPEYEARGKRDGPDGRNGPARQDGPHGHDGHDQRSEQEERPPGPALPPHRRIDPEKAHAALVPGDDDGLDLAVSIQSDHHEYAVRKLLNLINEIWVRLHDRHQRYLWDVFEAPME